MEQVIVEIPKIFDGLQRPYRYKVFASGRGAAKSWSFARVLLVEAVTRRIFVLCCREIQESIADSVYRLLTSQIRDLNLGAFFNVSARKIVCISTGSEFVFKGLRNVKSAEGVKSLEGTDICWIEEAQAISEPSLDLLLPTIRREKSEIWCSLNPRFPTDPIYKLFFSKEAVIPKNSLVKLITWRDNPWFPAVLFDQMKTAFFMDYRKYLHVWEGQLQTGYGGIFKRSWIKQWEPTSYDFLFLAANTAFSSESSTVSVLQLWGGTSEYLDLLDSIRGRWSFVQLLKILEDFLQKVDSALLQNIVIEDNPANQSLIQALLTNENIEVLQYQPSCKDSVSRAHLASSYVAAGRIRIPPADYAPWTKKFIEELTSYQADMSHLYSEQVDTLSMACDIWRQTIE